MTPLPSAAGVRDLLGDLLARNVTVGPGEPVVVSHIRPASVGVFSDPGGATVSTCALDLAMTGHAAGALALTPPKVVAQMLAERTPSDLLLDSLHEVMNVISVLVSTRGLPPAALSRVYHPYELLPARLHELLRQQQDRLDLRVTVPGYGVGALSLVTCR